jgi:hypothetical protein
MDCINREQFARIAAVFLLGYYLCVASTLAALLPGATTARGVVTHRISGCDYFLVQTRSVYDVLEWYGGHDPDKGDVLVGRYESYGFHDIYDETVDADGRVWTEDYSLSRESGLEKLTEQCE